MVGCITQHIYIPFEDFTRVGVWYISGWLCHPLIYQTFFSRVLGWNARISDFLKTMTSGLAGLDSADQSDLFDLIRSSKIYFLLGLFPAHDTLAFPNGLIEGNTAGGGLGIFLDLGFALGRFAPV